MLVSAVQHGGSFILVCVCVCVRTFFFRWAHLGLLNPLYVLCEVPGALLSWTRSSAILGEDGRAATLQVQRPGSAWLRACALATSWFLDVGAVGAKMGALLFLSPWAPAASPCPRPWEACWLPRARPYLLPGQPAASCVVRAEGGAMAQPQVFLSQLPGPWLERMAGKGGWECGRIKFIFL